MTKTINKGSFQNTNNSTSTTTNTGPVNSYTSNDTIHKNKNDLGGVMSGGTMNFSAKGDPSFGGSSGGGADGTVPPSSDRNNVTVISGASAASASAGGAGMADSVSKVTGPGNGENTIQSMQVTGPAEETIHNQEFVEMPNEDANFGDTVVESDYNVESIKAWLGREHRVSQFGVTFGSVLTIDKAFLKTLARGKLDFFRYFRADFVFTLRWNVPKTTFGAFVLCAKYGDIPAGAPDIREIQLAYVKVFADLQASSVTLEVPFLYPYSFLDLAANDFVMGRLFMHNFQGIHTVTDVVPTVSVRCYCHCKNISIMTPYPRSIISQGPVLGIMGLALGVAETASGIAANVSTTVSNAQQPQQSETTPAPVYQPSGFSAVRTVDEAVNLVRTDGFDPAIPMNRVVQPYTGKRDDFAITDMNQLISIPCYQTIQSVGGSFGGRHGPAEHEWFNEITAPYPFRRVNFHCRLHCLATPFHSGRLRIVYMPDNNDDLVQEHDNVAQGLSIVWDIQDNAVLDFDVPYGAASEWNVFPGFWVIQETPFTSPFGATVAPVIIWEWWCSDLMVMGFLPTRAPDDHLGGVSWTQPSFDTVYTPVIEAQGMEACGFYHDTHTSDNEYNTSLITSGRRPGELFHSSGSAFFSWTKDDTILISRAMRSVEEQVWSGYITRALMNSAAWRGSVKVIVQCVSRPTHVSWHVVAWYGVRVDVSAFDSYPAEFQPNGSEIVEFAVPYMSQQNFYTGVRGDPSIDPSTFAYDSLDGPTFQIQTSGELPDDPSTEFRVWLSVFDDFQIIMPGFYSSAVKPSPLVGKTRRVQAYKQPSVVDIPRKF